MIIEIGVSLLLTTADVTAVSEIAVSVTIPVTQVQSPGYVMIDSFYTSDATDTYTRPLINNKTVKAVSFGNMNLIPSQWNHTADEIQFTDTSFEIEAGTYVTILFTA